MHAYLMQMQRFELHVLVHQHLSELIRSSVWFWVTCQTLHFMGVAVLIGVVGFFDLRLLGFMKRVPLQAAMDLMPWAIVAFFVNMATGTVFLLGRPGPYVHAISLYFKFLFVMIAGINAIIFQIALKNKAILLGSEANTPMSMKLVGATSLLSWFAVLYFGRMVPYLGRF